MTDITQRLGNPKALSSARTIAHAAVQPLTKSARANLRPVTDDSHSNLQWSTNVQMFLTHDLGEDGGRHQIGLSLAPLRLIVLRDRQSIDELSLGGQSLPQSEDWLDHRLQDLGLEPASSAQIPYALPDDVADLKGFSEGNAGLDSLAAWFSLAADTLENFALELSDLDPGPSAIRCWPHHFDIATYVALERGDVETARGIGVGLSPGDDAYDQPYFYVNPWPRLDPTGLPNAIAPGHWHVEGFVGSIATGAEILALKDPSATTSRFLLGSFKASRGVLEA